MTSIYMIYDWSVALLKGLSNVSHIFNYSTITGYTILGLIGINGLLAFLGFAIIKWII